MSLPEWLGLCGFIITGTGLALCVGSMTIGLLGFLDQAGKLCETLTAWLEADFEDEDNKE